MHLLRGPLRLALLALALIAAVAAAPTISRAQDDIPQCSDGVDNDGDNAIDGADAGCADGTDTDESDSIYSGIRTVTVALPLVNLSGTVGRSGAVKVSKLTIRAKSGSTVNVTCTGKHCPFKTVKRTMLSSTLRLARLERKYVPALKLEMRIGRPGQLGKFVGYKVRRNKPPVRTDSCLDATTGDVGGCFGE